MTSQLLMALLLTFDDGPHPENTCRILNVLREVGHSAIFFALGERMARTATSGIAERIVAEGHVLGNHSFTHPALVRLHREAIRDELERTQELIERAGDVRRIFRPPYGATDDNARQGTDDLGYDTLLWTVDSLDWKLRQHGAGIAHTVREGATVSTGVVLMHDIYATTAAGLRVLLQLIVGESLHSIENAGARHVLGLVAR